MITSHRRKRTCQNYDYFSRPTRKCHLKLIAMRLHCQMARYSDGHLIRLPKGGFWAEFDGKARAKYYLADQARCEPGAARRAHFLGGSFFRHANAADPIGIGGDVLAPMSGLRAEPTPWFLRSGAAIGQTAATERLP